MRRSDPPSGEQRRFLSSNEWGSERDHRMSVEQSCARRRCHFPLPAACLYSRFVRAGIVMKTVTENQLNGELGETLVDPPARQCGPSTEDRAPAQASGGPSAS